MLDLRKMARAYLDALHPEQAAAEKQAALDKENEQADTIALLTLEMQQMKQALKEATIVENFEPKSEPVQRSSIEEYKPKRTRRKRNAEGILE